MKKLSLILMTALVLLSVVPMQLRANAAVSGTPVSTTTTDDSVRAAALTTRLEQINEMDKSHLSFSEKKQLRKEVRSIKSQLKAIGGGVYISAGALILIVILIILLL